VSGVGEFGQFDGRAIFDDKRDTEILNPSLETKSTDGDAAVGKH
jgi:hypothetical protein